MVKMWTKMKAHEACWGEENTKQYTVKMKKAIAKCTQQDAPELQLPIYRNPYRVVNGLLNGAQEHERYVVSLLETIANNMNNNNNNRMHNNMNTMSNGNFNQLRFKRQADAGVTNVLDLGDRLRDKIVEAEKHAEQKIGNMTCVMKEMNIINDNHEIDLAAMKQELRQMELSEWFQARIERDMDNCYAVAQNIPVDVQTAYAYPGNPHLAKLKAFMTCCKAAKTQSCVYQDVRDKLEKNFGPLQKLLDTTGLTEQQIFPLVLQLLHGSEMEFMETM